MKNSILIATLLAIFMVCNAFAAQPDPEFAAATAAGIGLAAASLGYKVGSDYANKDDDMSVSFPDVLDKEYLKNFIHKYSEMPKEQRDAFSKEMLDSIDELPPKYQHGIAFLRQKAMDKIHELRHGDAGSDLADVPECGGVCVTTAVVGGLAAGGATGYYVNK